MIPRCVIAIVGATATGKTALGISTILFGAGGESTASPKIWENMADFVAKAKSLETDAAAAAASADEAQFKEAAGKIFGNCKSCHEAFRKPS